jgi:tyrosinase
MPESVIENPTYLGDIRHFFEPEDIEHMGRLGIDLSTYESLKSNATRVYFQTKPPDPRMPPEPERQWSEERSKTFSNWIRNGFPLGEPTPQKPAPVEGAERLRKDAGELASNAIQGLAQAFQGIMDRPLDDPNSYFTLAGWHWLPVPGECPHHEDRFLPWHRAHLKKFEDALRSVPGSESVTLPYWDITQKPPDFLFQPPFDSYKLPKSIGPNFPAGFTTQHFSADQIAQNVVHEHIPGIIANALAQPHWGDFVSYVHLGLEAAHDAGHGSAGPVMAHKDAAAFDPIFWFFHANLDRLWWQWQQAMNATTVTTFRSTIMGSTDFLDPPFNDLPPFTGTTADQTIDLSAMGIAYTQPATPAPPPPLVRRALLGSLRAADAPRVHEAPQASVRLKGIDRLSIPGSFRAILRADGEEIGRRTFFQSTEPVECAHCRETAKINLDFVVDADQVLGKTLSASIEPVAPVAEGWDAIPLTATAVGDPTLNVRLLLERSS